MYNLFRLQSNSELISRHEHSSIIFSLITSFLNTNIIESAKSLREVILRILLKQNTALLSTVHVCVTGVTHIQGHKCHVNHQGTHQTLYILNPNHPGYLSSKDQTKQDLLLRPDQPDHLFRLIKRIIKKIYAESAVLTLSCSPWVSNFKPPNK